MSRPFYVPYSIHPAIVTVGGEHANIRGFTALAIQAAVDSVNSRGGGIVRLDEGIYIINRPIRLYSRISLIGAGVGTVLSKTDGLASRLTVDADYGELTVEVENASGFEAGMGVQIRDRHSRNFLISTAVITAIQGMTLHLDRSLVNSYTVEDGGVVESTCSIIEATEVCDVNISDLLIDGNKAHNAPMNGCVAGGIFLQRASSVFIKEVTVRGVSGDGISWQTTEHIEISACETYDNEGAGLHPGTGSIRSTVKDCRIHHNGCDGIYLCWRVKYGQFTGNAIHDNGINGISIGHKDTDNSFESNHLYDNRVGGICVRRKSAPNGAHRNRYANNVIENNGSEMIGGYGIWVEGLTRDNVFESNTIRDTGQGRQTRGIVLKTDVAGYLLINNLFSGHSESDVTEHSEDLHPSEGGSSIE